MPAQKFPVGASQEVQEAFREVWRILDTVMGTRNVDWRGRRIMNASDAVLPGDYVTKRQLEAGTASVGSALAQQTRIINAILGGVKQTTNPGTLIDGGLGEAIWPVDSVFVTAADENPGLMLGFGTWELVAVGAGAPGGEMVITVV